MKNIFLHCVLCAAALTSEAAWYWPFGNETKSPPRLSVLMTNVTDCVECAVGCLEAGDTHGAVTNYMNALEEIDAIRLNNPDLVGRGEFQSIKNREAYIEAAIESLLHKQVVETARPVVVYDTDNLVARLDEEVRRQRGVGRRDGRTDPEPKASESNSTFRAVQNVPTEPETAPTRSELLARIDSDIADGDYEAAELGIRKMLEYDPNDASALNLRAALEVAKGDYLLADATLQRVIRDVAPESYAGYFNLARLNLKKDPPDRRAAARYYKTGRDCGGEPKADLERDLKNELKDLGYTVR